jgi:hypothetical protein
MKEKFAELEAENEKLKATTSWQSADKLPTEEGIYAVNTPLGTIDGTYANLRELLDAMPGLIAYHRINNIKYFKLPPVEGNNE